MGCGHNPFSYLEQYYSPTERPVEELFLNPLDALRYAGLTRTRETRAYIEKIMSWGNVPDRGHFWRATRDDGYSIHWKYCRKLVDQQLL